MTEYIYSNDIQRNEENNMTIFTKNPKMKETEMHNPGTRFVNFNLPAIKTCPNAGECAKFCYARQGRYMFSNVANALEEHYKLTQQDNFRELVQAEIDKFKLDKYKYFVRIHDSGDFDRETYFADWILLAFNNPQVEFYAYTKMVSMCKKVAHLLPKNFTIIYSYGGKEDHLIDPEKDRHSKVFNSVEELEKAGYMDATGNDHVALETLKVGLPIHGTRKMKLDKYGHLIA